jgi:xanthine/uracil permease
MVSHLNQSPAPVLSSVIGVRKKSGRNHLLASSPLAIIRLVRICGIGMPTQVRIMFATIVCGTMNAIALNTVSFRVPARNASATARSHEQILP